MIINVRYRITNEFQEECYQETGRRPMSDQEIRIDSGTLLKEQLALLEKAKEMNLPYPYIHPIYDTYLQSNKLTLCQISHDEMFPSGMRIERTVFDHLPDCDEIFEVLIIAMAQYGAVKTMAMEVANQRRIGNNA